MRTKISILLFLSVFRLSGQTTTSLPDYILFHGIVMDAVSQTPVPNPGYHIRNDISGLGGADGKFSFYVTRGDTVLFTSLGYLPVTMIISDTLAGREYIAGIYLRMDTISIGEVIILPRIGNLKTEIMMMKPTTSQEQTNAQDNINISVYQGLNNSSTMGNPNTNYEMLRQKQRLDAKEKGGIPSDRMIGISPLLIIPAAYLLMNGLPSRPQPPAPRVTDQELERIRKIHNDLIYKKKE
jgi:hypothetical protein